MQKPIHGLKYIKMKAEIFGTAKISAFYFCAKKERILKILSCKLRIYIKFDIYLPVSYTHLTLPTIA